MSGLGREASAEEREALARGAAGFPPAGLCARCVYLRLLASPRSLFVRCALAETDPRFPRYPGLPVLDCAGFRQPWPERSGGADPG